MTYDASLRKPFTCAVQWDTRYHYSVILLRDYELLYLIQKICWTNRQIIQNVQNINNVKVVTVPQSSFVFFPFLQKEDIQKEKR